MYQDFSCTCTYMYFFIIRDRLNQWFTPDSFQYVIPGYHVPVTNITMKYVF